MSTGAADWTKHGKAARFAIPPNKIVSVDPEGKGGIRPYLAGPAVLYAKLNLSGLPAPGKGRPTRVLVWARRLAEGDPANATGQGTFAVPQDADPELRIVWSYATYLEQPGSPVTFHVQHNGTTTIQADLEQIIAVAFTPWAG